MSLIFITFIFKLNNKTFYGKYYTDTISPDHEGLDAEIKPYLLQGISEYHKRRSRAEQGIWSGDPHWLLPSRLPNKTGQHRLAGCDGRERLRHS